jgi:hypothetical protein
MDIDSDQKFVQALQEELDKRGIADLSQGPYVVIWAHTIQLDGDFTLAELEAIVAAMKKLDLGKG